jgi:LysM repeat protein
MKVQKTKQEKNPGYPNWRQFRGYGTLAGVAVIGLSTVVAGCRSAARHTRGVVSEEPVVTTRLRGEPPFEPSAKSVTNSQLAVGETSSYTVQKGDTLWSIAKRHLGKGNRWSEIASVNPNLTPETLKTGQKILIPKMTGVTTTTTRPGTNESQNIRTPGRIVAPR